MRTINALSLDSGGSRALPKHVPWKDRYHSPKINKYIRNYSRNIGAYLKAHPVPSSKSQLRGARSSKDDDNLTHAQPVNHGEDKSGQPSERAQPAMTTE
eukprot:4220624-Karenia_brevis.AAC.1